MVWFILSIPSGFGVALFMNGLANIPPVLSMASGGIIVLGCLWIGIREQRHKKRTGTIGEIFFNINIHALKSSLYIWVATDAYKNLIKRVVLYRAVLDSTVPVSVKYIVFFDVVYNQKTEVTRKVHQNFLKNKTPILGDDFGDVYKGNPPVNFHDEWLLTDKKPDGTSGKHGVVLFLKNPICRLFT
ncbi:MAG: hypothetical protein H8D67_26745 [Deltaproteobacteria bacterium]|nr:hypothetical protein [Deltaproteobacteria bacterium]